MGKASTRRRPEPQAKPERKWWIPASLIAIALAAYSNSFGLGLAQDSRVIVEDARIRAVTAENVTNIVTKDYWWPNSADLIYRPATTLSYLINYAVLGSGANPAGYHAINFLLHALNVWLVYLIALRLLSNLTPAFFAAALWAVHPIATEAVDNVVGRADLIAAMAVLAGLLLYLREANPLAIFGVGLVGVFAKENAVVLPAVLLLSDVMLPPSARTMRSRISAYAAAILPVLILLAARAAVFSALPSPNSLYTDNILRGLPFWQARFTAIKVIGLDLWLLVWPVSLASDRSFQEIQAADWSSITAWVSLAICAGLLAWAAIARRTQPVLPWCVGFLGIALLPTSNLLVVIGSAMAERFLYLPSVALAIAAVVLVWRFLTQQTAAYVMAGLLVLCAGRTWARNSDWQNNFTLGIADTKTAPGSVRLHDMLARELYSQGLRNRNVDAAIREEETAWAILSPLPPERSSDQPPANLGTYYFVKAGFLPEGQNRSWYEKSEAVLLRAREISQTIERAFDQAQMEHGKPPAARQGSPVLYVILAEDQMHLNRYNDAIESLRYARALNPLAPETYDSLAAAYQAAGQADRAAMMGFEKALITGSEAPGLGSPGDPCPAAADLMQAFHDGRMTAQAVNIQAEIQRRFGCPAR